MPVSATKDRRSRCISSIQKPEYTTPFQTKTKNRKSTRFIVYNRVIPLIRIDPGQKSGQIGPSQVVVQQRFPVGVCWNCGDPSHYASACPLRAGQGAPLPLPCQNCGEQEHDLPRCPKPLQVRPVYKQVEILPREQTGLNYGCIAGVKNLGK